MVNKVIFLFVVICAVIALASYNSLTEKDRVQYIATTTEGVIIYPTFTDIGYSKAGFYKFLAKTCDTCKTASLDATNEYNPYGIGNEGLKAMKKYYPVVTDIQVDKDPSILKKFDKIIVMHNEFVTKKEFDAITNHTNVVYLYPDSLRSSVSVDYVSKTATLIQANGYPNATKYNAFDWKYDSHKNLVDCKTVGTFTKINNGWQYSCYPEAIITKQSGSIYSQIKDLK